MASGIHRMVSSTGEPAYAVDRHGTIVAWNRAASRMFGYPDEAALGRKCWELLQGRDAFGNEYCGSSCPIRRMAVEHRSVNRCRLNFRTLQGERRSFTVTTLVVFQDCDTTLIHLCRMIDTGRADSAAGYPAGDITHSVLTQREREVVQHLADGHSTREIATLLSISVSTVRSHVEHILRKLHAHSRLEAVAVSRRLGLD